MIQHVKIDAKINYQLPNQTSLMDQLISGLRAQNPKLEWWEAWRVDPGQTTPTQSFNGPSGKGYAGINANLSQANDWWSLPDAKPAAGGYWESVRYQAEARYYDMMPTNTVTLKRWLSPDYDLFSGWENSFFYPQPKKSSNDVEVSHDIGIQALGTTFIANNPKTRAGPILSTTTRPTINGYPQSGPVYRRFFAIWKNNTTIPLNVIPMS